MSSTAGRSLSEIMPRVYRSVKEFSTGRQYVRLHDEPRRKRRTIRMGKRLAQRLRVRRPKIKLRLRLRRLFLSPIKLLKKVRDAYVRMMLALAEKGDFSAAVMGNGFYFPGGQPCRRPLGMDSRKEDEIMAYIDYLRTRGKLVSDPVMER